MNEGIYQVAQLQVPISSDFKLVAKAASAHITMPYMHIGTCDKKAVPRNPVVYADPS